MTLRKDSFDVGNPSDSTLRIMIKGLDHRAHSTEQVVVNRLRLDEQGKPVGTRMERRIAKAQLRKHERSR